MSGTEEDSGTACTLVSWYYEVWRLPGWLPRFDVRPDNTEESIGRTRIACERLGFQIAQNLELNRIVGPEQFGQWVRSRSLLFSMLREAND
jgi:hypothetical protein